MNILFFSHEISYGGASRALISLIKDLKKGNNVYVVVPSKKSKIITELENMGIKVINSFYGWWEIPVRTNVLNKIIYRILYFLEPVFIVNLLRIIKRLDIDIIHSNSSVIDIGARVAKKLKKNHVWHFREFTGIHLKFIKGESKSYDFINDNAGSIIYVSKAIKDFYEENVSEDIGTLIYDGISKDFMIHKDYVKKDKVTFLLVATLEENKGQSLAIKAAHLLVDKGICNFEILFAGGNPTNYLDKLNLMINEYCLIDNIKYIGFVDNMKKLRENVDVELMCAPREAFGLVTAEAMMAGNPVIGSNSGGTSEIIKDGVTGFLYELNNESSLASKMEMFIKDTKLIEKSGKKGQKRALDKFESKRNYLETIQLYKKIEERE